MPQPTAIIIEDEPQIRRFVRAALEAEGWQVFEADTAQRGLTDAGTRKPDLLVLDLGLPDADGMRVIADVRGWSAVPIIVLSARSDEADKIAALDALSRLATPKKPRRYSNLAMWKSTAPRAWCAAPGPRCTSHPPSTACCRCWPPTPAVCSHSASYCVKCGGHHTPTKAITYAFTWATCGKSSRPTRPSPNTC
jgi:CheY-like chemotaxis protein